MADTARTRALRDLAEEIYRSRPDLREELPPDVRAVEFCHWMFWHGLDEYPELAAAMYPTPPQALCERVAGTAITEEAFRRGGAVDRRRLHLCLEEGGYDFSSPGRILDFGAGCGRILRLFSNLADTTAFVACDIDREALAWVRGNLDFALPVAVAAGGSLPFGDRTFDGVMAFSVFTHLPEQDHLECLRELRRVTVPGGVVVVSTHGEHALRLYAEGRRMDLHPPPDAATAAAEPMRRDGFAFVPYPGCASNRAQYGTAFLTEPYVRREWSRIFEVRAFHAAPDGWQDFVVLINRGT